jgi:ribosome-binding protein aMBF1 (putative translation factor)
MAKNKQHALASGLQIRAARGFLCWDRRDLAREAAVPSASIERIETGHQPAGKTAENLSVIQSVLETKGIEFTDDNGVLGVRMHDSIETPDLSRERAQ